jgi:hypothetical protein
MITAVSIAASADVSAAVSVAAGSCAPAGG